MLPYSQKSGPVDNSGAREPWVTIRSVVPSSTIWSGVNDQFGRIQCGPLRPSGASAQQRAVTGGLAKCKVSLIAAVSLRRHIGSTAGGGSGLSMVRTEVLAVLPQVTGG